MRIMKRMMAALAALALLIASGAAGESPRPATPSNLDCPHEHTRYVYYFDRPAYAPVNDKVHRVYGPAVLEIVCTECGAVLSSEYRENAEQKRSHTFRNGVCVLCGQPESADTAEPEPTETPSPAEEDGAFLADTLTNMTNAANIILFGCADPARCCR